MEKTQEEKLLFEFDKILMNEEYAEAFAFAIDNGIERQALRICIEYVQEDDERTEREMEEQRSVRRLRDAMKSRIPMSKILITADDWKLQFEQEYQQRPVPEDTPEIKDGTVNAVTTCTSKTIKNPFYAEWYELTAEWYELTNVNDKRLEVNNKNNMFKRELLEKCTN